ncbi:hypothetical protein DACRYDRAFT_106760 [Dacryopinax primogenitus]|uniref:Uncharacterized protein n=1 Tax=Dacryopinax primogenitus (strain DJM 731) TaxID=1858805 RepID=M5G9Y8_DACPD|nr:uncharacterized protein DACRYDRAFT_106760 [Dacryopinax primogenitus]EJU02697.1 hypothetical protein DACRYDRAFT_106760 [Dacryopinax primogenitus]
MVTPTGTCFFPQTWQEAIEQNKLWLGVLLSMDRFSPSQSTVSKSHSTGPLSVCITNLPPELRFCVRNLCLIGILPGPKEPNAQQLQPFLCPLVDNLLCL